MVIRGGPDSFPGYTARSVLAEWRLPVCSPALLDRKGLRTVADLRNHTLLDASSIPRLWRDWLSAAGHAQFGLAAASTFDHFYLSIQAALGGLRVAMGPTTLVADVVAAGPLLDRFPPSACRPTATTRISPPGNRPTGMAGSSATGCW